MALTSVLKAAHNYLEPVLGPGDVAVDATAGNGHDTVFLAKQVEDGGAVYGFDVQAAAIRSTSERLEKEGVRSRVTLVQESHDSLDRHLPASVRGSVGAVAFNLGYLPGGDKSLITRPDTTVAALSAAADVVRPGGRIAVVLYTGHEGGDDEAKAVHRWAKRLDRARFDALSYHFLNHANDPPQLLVKRGLVLDRLRDPVRAEDHGGAVGDLLELLDEHRALLAQVLDHPAVVHHLVAHVDGRAEHGECALDDLDRAVDAGAEAAWVGEENIHGRLRNPALGRVRV